MPKSTIRFLVLDLLAQERRVIVADWRFHVAYMRVARSHGYSLPDACKASAFIKSLLGKGEIAPFEDILGVYRIATPYASIIPAPQESIIQEANPFAVFNHLTAAAYHDLTHEIPTSLHVAAYGNSIVRLPLGTTPEDWIDIPEPHRRTPAKIAGTPIEWVRPKAEWDFGVMVGHVQGNPIYITDLERTLLDSLRFPSKCGGALEVLRIWKRSASKIKTDTLVGYVDRFGQTLLRQRVGFMLEQLGVSHPVLDDWAKSSVRGGSAKLISDREFLATFSERWNLSINVPDYYLSELREFE